MPLKKDDAKKLAGYLKTGCDAMTSAKRLLESRNITWEDVIDEVITHFINASPPPASILDEGTIAQQVDRMLTYKQHLPQYELNWLLQKQGWDSEFSEGQMRTFNGIKRLLEAHIRP